MNDGFKTEIIGGLPLTTAGIITARHAFTTRHGGVSDGICESLNLGENRGDDPANVRENYRRLGNALGFDYRNLVFTRQIHGNEVRIVNAGDRHELFGGVPYDADGLVTNEPGVPLIAFTADCAPLLMHDPVAGVIAAVHCGWRGTVADIIASAVYRMERLGAVAANIRAAVGPAIGKCCFEVGPEVPEAIAALIGDRAEALIVPGKPGKFYADLPGVCRARLETLGVESGNIAVSDECTYCNSDKYWSHRATNGQRGSQAAVIMLQA